MQCTTHNSKADGNIQETAANLGYYTQTQTGKEFIRVLDF